VHRLVDRLRCIKTDLDNFMMTVDPIGVLGFRLGIGVRLIWAARKANMPSNIIGQAQ
jgi:hypothetical protein